MQKIACAYWVLHYFKRIAETFLVHRWGGGLAAPPAQRRRGEKGLQQL